MSLNTLFDHVLDNDTVAVDNYLTMHPGGKRAKRLAIVYAAAMGNAEIVAVTLKHGICINTYDVFNNFRRHWEPIKLKKLQALIENDMKQFTRGWSPAITPACVAAFYGHKNVLSVLCKHDFRCMSFNPYLTRTLFTGEGKPPSWNAVTCALFGQQWDIATALVDRGVVTTNII